MCSSDLGLLDVRVERAGVADARRAAVADEVEAELVEVRREAGLLEVIRHHARSGSERSLHGATMGFFPIDEDCVNYLRATGRSDAHCQMYENYYKAQGLWGIPQAGQIEYSQVVELDLASVKPSVAGPKRPQDRIELPNLRREFFSSFQRPVTENGFGKTRKDFSKSVKVEMTSKKKATVGTGSVLIAAITSCTNTSNPSVMIAAGLLAKKAVEKGHHARSRRERSLHGGIHLETFFNGLLREQTGGEHHARV